MEPEKKIIRWKEYFANLLNGAIPPKPIENATYQKAESFVKEISKEEVREAIKNLKNLKAPGSDIISSELIKYGGEDMYNLIYRICRRRWLEEKMPENWNEAIIIPLHKGDKTECSDRYPYVVTEGYPF